VDDVELCAVFTHILERICLMELERIMRLREMINSDNLKARSMVAHRCSTGATE